MYLEWLDSAATRGWQPRDSSGLLPIRSLGWLVEDTKEYVTITTSVSQERYMDQLTIPRRAVLKLMVLSR